MVVKLSDYSDQNNILLLKVAWWQSIFMYDSKVFAEQELLQFDK